MKRIINLVFLTLLIACQNETVTPKQNLLQPTEPATLQSFHNDLNKLFLSYNLKPQSTAPTKISPAQKIDEAQLMKDIDAIASKYGFKKETGINERLDQTRYITGVCTYDTVSKFYDSSGSLIGTCYGSNNWCTPWDDATATCWLN